MPSFGELMIQDFLQAGQQYRQGVSQNVNDLQNQQQLTQQGQRIKQQQASSQNQLTQDAIQGQRQADTQQRQLDLQQQQIMLAHQDRQERMQMQQAEQLAKSARAWGKSLALQQVSPQDFDKQASAKVNPLWPDYLKEEAFIGYEEGKGMLGKIDYQGQITGKNQAARDNRKQGFKFSEFVRKEALKNGVDLTEVKGMDEMIQAIASKKNYKDKLAAAKASLAPLFAQSYAMKGMSRSAQRAAATEILQRAQVSRQDIQNIIDDQFGPTDGSTSTPTQTTPPPGGFNPANGSDPFRPY